MRVAEEKLYWDQASADPDVDIKYIADVDTEECLKVIRSFIKPGTILEIGSGVGRLAIPLAKDSYSVCGIDISAAMIKEATKRADADNVGFWLCDGRSIPFSNGLFDSAYSMLVFQHLPFEGVHSYIYETSRVLKQDGVFCFQFIEGSEDEPFSHHHNLAEVIQALDDAGFEIADLQKGLIHPQWSWIKAVRL